jgi:hypothetical protein
MISQIIKQRNITWTVLLSSNDCAGQQSFTSSVIFTVVCIAGKTNVFEDATGEINSFHQQSRVRIKVAIQK